MARDLLTPTYPAPDVERATGATLAMQRNWIARDLYQTPTLPEPRAGHARMFPLLAVYESAIYAYVASRGIDIGVASTAFRKRLETEGLPRLAAKRMRADGAPGFGFWQAEAAIEAVASERLWEFERSRTNPIYWIISLGGDAPIITDRAALVAALAELDQQPGVSLRLIINVSALVDEVDTKLGIDE